MYVLRVFLTFTLRSRDGMDMLFVRDKGLSRLNLLFFLLLPHY
jgi:hypothetical protein